MNDAPRVVSLDDVVHRVVDARRRVPAHRAVLVAVTGIDACGKGYFSDRLVERLEARSLQIALIHADAWLNLPDARFDPANPAEHFYQNAIRFDEMFTELVLPLRNHRSHRVEADVVEETAAAFRRHVYQFDGADVVVLEGIYLLKPVYRDHYDLSVWVECSYETALERALARRQEGLSDAATVAAYRTIYFPAQDVHIARDDPKRAATVIVHNDPVRRPA